VVERTRVRELARLDVDRHAWEEAVAAAVVKMQVSVDDGGDVAGDVLGVRRRAHIVDLGPRVDHPGVDEHEPVRVVDRPDEHGQALAVDEELCREVGVDHAPTLPPEACARSAGRVCTTSRTPKRQSSKNGSYPPDV